MKYLLIVLLLSPFFGVSQIDASFERVKFFNSEKDVVARFPALQSKRVVKTKIGIQVIGDGGKTLKSTIGQVPSRLNSFIFSPNNEYFVAFEETEGVTNDLFFYDASGRLLSTQRVNIYPNVKFSNNGEQVIAFNSFGREIFIFSKTGILIFEGDYTNLIGDKTKILAGVIVDSQAKQILINADNDVYLISMGSKQRIFKETVGRVLDGMFFEGKGKILLTTISSERDKCDLKVLSGVSGKHLDELNGLSNVRFISEGFLIRKNSNIEQYEVK